MFAVRWKAKHFAITQHKLTHFIPLLVQDLSSDDGGIHSIKNWTYSSVSICLQ